MTVETLTDDDANGFPPIVRLRLAAPRGDIAVDKRQRKSAPDIPFLLPKR